jgi:dTDP-4-amino-4,6-dideoxyglucose formyltransferase
MIKVLVLTDNVFVFEKFKSICQQKSRADVVFKFFCSPSSKKNFSDYEDVNVLDVKNDYESIINNYQLVISCHCKKIFPEELVSVVRCINIHPGLNPYNRGWYPQVFAINNGMPHGATIHEMDEEIDHGNIIAQRNILIDMVDTSADVYDRVVRAEIELFEQHFDDLIDNTYVAKVMKSEGNYNSIQDFRDICNIDLDRKGTFLEFYNLMRSLTHGKYKNAYIIDEQGDKVFLSINIEQNKE